MNITLQNLTKRFPARGRRAQGEVTAVEDLSFQIQMCIRDSTWPRFQMSSERMDRSGARGTNRSAGRWWMASAPLRHTATPRPSSTVSTVLDLSLIHI